MPLAPLINLLWYGPASISFVVEEVVDPPLFDIRVAARIPEVSIDGGGQEPALHATLLVGNGFEIEAISEVELAPMRGSIRINIDIDVGAQPSVQEIVAGVLDALASAYNKPGTIGAKINSSGAGGDPWADSRALTVAKFLGLK